MQIVHIFFLLLATLTSGLADVKAPLVLLPRGMAANEALPVAIWLHGYGANPSKILEEPLYQAVSDRLHIAIVGVYATNQINSESFEWSELPTFDYSQITDSLVKAEQENHVKFSKKMLFGFSQGACVAVEIASRYPEVFSGAIVLSPGANQHPGPLLPHDANKRQIYYLSCGAAEAAGNLEFMRSYAIYLSKIGATVSSREVPNMKIHSRPPDWSDRFPEWAKVILGMKE